MVETSTLTASQQLRNKLGTGHPGKQVLELLERVERLEKKVFAPKKTRAEVLALARAAKASQRAKKNEVQ